MSEKNQNQTHSEQLNDVLLRQILGGDIDSGDTTLMKCEKCSGGTSWSGNYMNGEYYECPFCHEKSFHGVKYIP